MYLAVPVWPERPVSLLPLPCPQPSNVSFSRPLGEATEPRVFPAGGRFSRLLSMVKGRPVNGVNGAVSV